MLQINDDSSYSAKPYLWNLLVDFHEMALKVYDIQDISNKNHNNNKQQAWSKFWDPREWGNIRLQLFKSIA